MTETSLDARALAAQLIAFPTVSRESNLALIEFVRDYLARHGVEAEIFHNPEGSKASLFATIGPRDRGGIVLSGHTDVVPVEGQAWSMPPFEGIVRDGRVWGRGAADMKGFLAAVLAAVPAFQARDLKTPIHLAFSYDEEVGCVGVRPMLRALAARAERPLGCIIGEPTEMKVVGGHKGKLAIRCEVRGLECHSALAPQGVNAIEIAAELVVKLRGMARDLAAKGPFDPRFEPAFTTMQTGVVQGGTTVNIVPNACWFDFEIRPLPGADPRAILAALEAHAAESLVPEMHAKSPATGIAFRELSSYPGLAPDEDEPIVALAKELTGANATGTVSFGTEGGLFREAGIPAVICGPGSMQQGHKPDEYVSFEQLELCGQFLRRLAERLEARPYLAPPTTTAGSAGTASVA